MGAAPINSTLGKEPSSSEQAYIKLELTTTDAEGNEIASDKASIYMHGAGENDWDSYDSSKIIPSLADTFSLIAYVGEKNGQETLKSQESRPYQTDSVVVVETRFILSETIPSDASFTLSVDTWYEVPDGWSVKVSGAAIEDELVFDSPSSSYTFPLNAESKSHHKGKASSDTTEVAMTSEVGPSSGTLPVELAEFTASLAGRGAQLQWQTFFETNNAGFAIEHRRKATGPSEWTKVGFVEGAGTTTQPQSYRFTVEELNYGTHTFRLRQVDTDGTTSVHAPETVKLRLNDRFEVSALYPNPAQKGATLDVTVQERQPVAVEVYDVQGRRIRTVHQRTLAGQQTRRIRVPTEGLSSSLYFLRVKGRDFVETRRLTVVR